MYGIRAPWRNMVKYTVNSSHSWDSLTSGWIAWLACDKRCVQDICCGTTDMEESGAWTRNNSSCWNARQHLRHSVQQA